MRTMTCIEDLRQTARRKVPRAFFEYAEAGAYAEETLRANRADLERIKLRQRILVDVADRSTKTAILGEPASLPLALAPVGLSGMQHGDGEILACRAAHEAGIPFCLSTMSICSIEDVAAAVDKPFWFQLYVMKDRGFVRSLIERAIAAKCSALMLTVDLQVLGQRHRDIKNGMTVPPQLRIKNLIDIASKPAWALSVLRGKRKTFGNLAGHISGMDNVNCAVAVGRRPVRCGAELEGRRVDRRAVAAKSSSSRASSISRTPALRQKPARRLWSCPITAAASSTARRPRFPCCRRSPTRSARTSRSCSTAASAPARTFSARSRSAPAPA